MRRQPVSPHSQESPTQHGLPPQPQEEAAASAREASQAAGNKSLLRPQGWACSALLPLSLSLSASAAIPGKAPGRAKRTHLGRARLLSYQPGEGRPAAPFCWSGKGGTNAGRERGSARQGASPGFFLHRRRRRAGLPSLLSRQKLGAGRPADEGVCVCFRRGR